MLATSRASSSRGLRQHQEPAVPHQRVPSFAAVTAGCRKLTMVASRPMDVSNDQPRMDASTPMSASTASPPSPLRPLLPAERDINAAMDGFNAGVVNFLKGNYLGRMIMLTSFDSSCGHLVLLNDRPAAPPCLPSLASIRMPRNVAGDCSKM